jgi:hypothetical protein
VLDACAQDSTMLDNPAVMRFLTTCAHDDLYSLLVDACNVGFRSNTSDYLSDAMPMLHGAKTAIVAQVQLGGRDFVITTGMRKAFVLPRVIGDMIAGIRDNVFAAPFSIIAAQRDMKPAEPNIEYMECIFAIHNSMLEKIEALESLPAASQHNSAPDLALLTAGESLMRLGTGFARPELPLTVNLAHSNVIHIWVLQRVDMHKIQHTARTFKMQPITLVKLVHGSDQCSWYTTVYDGTNSTSVVLSTRFVKTVTVQAKDSQFCVVEPYSDLPF